MSIKRSILFSWVLLAAFIIAALIRKNYEFLFYASSLILLVLIIQISDKKFDYPKIALWGMNSWLILHLLGGMAKIGSTRLYDFMLLDIIGEPYHILKYDQFVHAYCYFFAAFFIYTLIKKEAPKMQWGLAVFLTIVASIGIGGINEIIEFMAVVLVDSNGVGGYYNTAIDLVANTIGAIFAIPFLKKL
ncbi:hypothetical protein BVX95_00805 [archaeon D22]|nr:hypothetical protein BVX95_00805 [archaeon D22]